MLRVSINFNVAEASRFLKPSNRTMFGFFISYFSISFDTERITMSITSNFFQISPYFSFRWVDNDISSPYNTLPLDSLIDELSYWQPVQCGGGGFQSDIGQIHVLSSFVPTCTLRDAKTDRIIKTVTLTPLDPPVLNVDFVYYIAECDFSDVVPGVYYLKITYTDENDTIRDWRTSPLDVAIFHEGTQRIEATNTYNDKGCVFVTGNSEAPFNWAYFRVASLIRQPLVKTDAQDYEDQYNDLTQETSIPFVIYTQCIGGSGNQPLLPFWVIEKINLLYSLDSVLIDGQPFAKIANAEFKPTRADVQPQGAWWEVDIQPNYSYPAEIYITGTPSDDEIVVIKKKRKYTAVSADFAAIGVFTAETNFIRIALNNIGGDIFTLKVGLSEGDDSIASFDIPADFDDSLDVGKFFLVPTTVWFSGLAGTNLDLTIDYNDYRAKAIPSIPTSSGGFVKNTLYYFVEVVAGDFAAEFDVATGLGRVGTDHEGCVLVGSPSDVLPNYKGLLPRIWDSQEILPAATRQTIIGNNSRLILAQNLPQHTHFIANDDVFTGAHDLDSGTSLSRKWTPGSTSLNYNTQGTATAPTRGISSPFPATGQPNSVALDVTNRAIILPAFYFVGI